MLCRSPLQIFWVLQVVLQTLCGSGLCWHSALEHKSYCDLENLESKAPPWAICHVPQAHF